MFDFFYCKFLFFVITSAICIGGLTGCVLIDPVARIEQRRFFTVANVDQSNIDNLKKSYSMHYDSVKKELAELQKLIAERPEDSEIISEKIAGHKSYLYTMENYLFLCPSHKTEFIEQVEKKCPDCWGRGKRVLSSEICSKCSGTGKISFMAKTTKKCDVCRQYYRGSLKGADIYVNQ